MENRKIAKSVKRLYHFVLEGGMCTESDFDDLVSDVKNECHGFELECPHDLDVVPGALHDACILLDGSLKSRDLCAQFIGSLFLVNCQKSATAIK